MGLIIDVTRRKPPVSVGNKAVNLRKLAGIGMKTPQTYAIKWEAYQRYVKDDDLLIDELKAEIAETIDPGKTYAVRSSANIEDSMDRSFAGQFKSVLHVQGVDNVFQAVWAVWSSAQTPAVKTYLERHNVPASELAVGDLIRIRPGDNVAADGVIMSGQGSFNQATITGESLPADKKPGDEVFAGTQNLTGVLEIKVSRAGTDTTLGRVREGASPLVADWLAAVAPLPVSVESSWASASKASPAASSFVSPKSRQAKFSLMR